MAEISSHKAPMQAINMTSAINVVSVYKECLGDRENSGDYAELFIIPEVDQIKGRKKMYFKLASFSGSQVYDEDSVMVLFDNLKQINTSLLKEMTSDADGIQFTLSSQVEALKIRRPTPGLDGKYSEISLKSPAFKKLVNMVIPEVESLILNQHPSIDLAKEILEFVVGTVYSKYISD